MDRCNREDRKRKYRIHDYVTCLWLFEIGDVLVVLRDIVLFRKGSPSPEINKWHYGSLRNKLDCFKANKCLLKQPRFSLWLQHNRILHFVLRFLTLKRYGNVSVKSAKFLSFSLSCW